jgi:toxin-antitoxin system PIN domain toxin
MLVDANLLLYAIDEGSRHHGPALEWWEAALNGRERVALPWQTIGAFVRISTHPRINERPLGGDQAWAYVHDWLDAPTVWIPSAGAATARVYGELASSQPITGNLVPDAMLAALAIEHGLELHSADTDFARFPTLRWVNPLTG